MVKKRVQKAKRRRAKARDTGEPGSDGEEARDGPAPPEHIKRKVAKQAQFMQRIVENRPLVLSAKSSLKKKKKRKPLSAALGDLTSLAASLAEAAKSSTPGSGAGGKALKGLGVGGCKQRTRITDRETARLQQVLAHPQFRADPISAITSHLAATLPPAPAPPRAKKQQRSGEMKRSKAQQKRAAREMDTA